MSLSQSYEVHCQVEAQELLGSPSKPSARTQLRDNCWGVNLHQLNAGIPGPCCAGLLRALHLVGTGRKHFSQPVALGFWLYSLPGLVSTKARHLVVAQTRAWTPPVTSLLLFLWRFVIRSRTGDVLDILPSWRSWFNGGAARN